VAPHRGCGSLVLARPRTPIGLIRAEIGRAGDRPEIARHHRGATGLLQVRGNGLPHDFTLGNTRLSSGFLQGLRQVVVQTNRQRARHGVASVTR